LKQRVKIIKYIVLCCILVLGCDSNWDPNEQASGSAKTVKGVSLLDWSQTGYVSNFANTQIDLVQNLGASHLGIIATYYQSDPYVSDISATSRTPSLATIEEVLNESTERGLKVLLKPHVDLENGESRTSIDPDSPTDWFATYRDLILPLADLAEQYAVSHFIVGTELGGTIQYENDWRLLITEIRSRFSGQLVYAANWDEVYEVPFWDALDLIGVDFYYPISDASNPSRLELLENWQLWLGRLSLLRDQVSKNILFTEIGYRSIDGAGIRPYDFQIDGSPDPEEQADLYWAAIEACADKDWIEGLLWWGWPAYRERNSTAATGYTPKGKPAEEILRLSWQ